MKAVILAGGLGTRISEETLIKPKPMVEIGDKPILWHIMKIYSHHGINDFVICLGYKGNIIKEYFSNYFLHMSDVTFDIANNETIIHQKNAEPWKVTLVDTGKDTQTGGRIKRIKKYLENEESFCLTYGDGVSNVNIKELVAFHFSHKKIATVTAVKPEGRFGHLVIKNSKIINFNEKPEGDGSFISGGFFVFNNEVFNYISDDSTIFEKEPLEKLSKDGQLMAFCHEDFWHPMDTLRDKLKLDSMWKNNKAPWKVW